VATVLVKACSLLNTPLICLQLFKDYFSLVAMKRGFQEGCRSLIGLDGCFLKGPYKCTLLATVGRDVNNIMYPIAIVMVEVETKDSWSWFLETLLSNLGCHDRCNRPTFISDRQKVSYIYCTFI
jgi:hypothetical protein